MSVFPSVVMAYRHLALPRDRTRLVLGCRLVSGAGGVPRRLASLDELAKALTTLGLRMDSDPRDDGGRTPVQGRLRVNHTEWALWVREQHGKPVDDARVEKAREQLAEMCDWIGPVYVSTLPSGAQEWVCPLPSVLLVRLHAQLTKAEIKDALATLHEFGFAEQRVRSRDLGGRYLELRESLRRTVFDLLPELSKKLQHAIARLDYEFLPHTSPYLYEPGDLHFGAQWNMPLIQAPAAWDITRGDPSVVIAVLDSGCELGHPDLDVLRGFNLRTPGQDGRTVRNAVGRLDAHGTNVAGIAAAIMDNTPSPIGVAGVAAGCRVLPMASDGATDLQVAFGINRAVREGARVINISLSAWFLSAMSGEVGDAIVAADAAGVLICASAGNGDLRGIVSPARHPLVMACGGSDRTDARWSTTLPSGARFGSHYGDEVIGGVPSGISVVAPAWDLFPSVGMPTTDLIGTEGEVALPSPAGDYWVIGGFSMTSAAAPHVAGVAALLFSLHPSLDGREVRRIIERTADKVGPVPYTVVDGFPNGTRNEEMGYGRLNAFRAVDLADVMIRDWIDDDGEEPSSPPDGRFWVSPDIVVRPEDDGLFVPSDPLLSSQLTADQDNFVYVRVANKGPQVARNVRVSLRAVVGAAAFVYPDDWERTNDVHLAPEPITTTFGSVAANTSVLASFRIPREQANVLAAWSASARHPCLLAQVHADNDHAFTGARDSDDALITRRNNLAQRNLQVVHRMSAPLMHEYIVDVNHEAEEDAEILLRIDAGLLAQEGVVTVCVLEAPPSEGPSSDVPSVFRHRQPGSSRSCAHRLVLLDAARVASYQCDCETVLTLPAGAELSVGTSARARIVRASGAERSGAHARNTHGTSDRCVRLVKSDATLTVARPPGSRLRVTLRCESPAQFATRRYAVHLWREDVRRGAIGRIVGGVTLLMEPHEE